MVLHIHWERGVTLDREAPFSSGPFLARGSAVCLSTGKTPSTWRKEWLSPEGGIWCYDTESTANEKCTCFIIYIYICAWLLQFLYSLVCGIRYISRIATQYGFFLLHFELFLSNHLPVKANDMLNGIFSKQFLRIYTFVLLLFSLV